MPGVVPQPDGRLGHSVFVTEEAHAGRVQKQKPSRRGLQAEPAGCEYPQKMAARKNQHVPVNRPQAFHHAVGPRANLERRFSAGAAVVKQLPAGGLGVNFHRAQPFVVAIVPLDELAVHFGGGAEPGQLASSPGALQRTGEDFKVV